MRIRKVLSGAISAVIAFVLCGCLLGCTNGSVPAQYRDEVNAITEECSTVDAYQGSTWNSEYDILFLYFNYPGYYNKAADDADNYYTLAYCYTLLSASYNKEYGINVTCCMIDSNVEEIMFEAYNGTVAHDFLQ